MNIEKGSKRKGCEDIKNTHGKGSWIGDLGFGIWDLRFEVWDLGFGIWILD